MTKKKVFVNARDNSSRGTERQETGGGGKEGATAGKGNHASHLDSPAICLAHTCPDWRTHLSSSTATPHRSPTPAPTLMSAPAAKARSEPVMTIAPTEVSRSKAWDAALISRIRVELSALS